MSTTDIGGADEIHRAHDVLTAAGSSDVQAHSGVQTHPDVQTHPAVA